MFDVFNGCLLAMFNSGEYFLNIYIYIYEVHVPLSARFHGCNSDVPVFQLPGKMETIITASPGSWNTGNQCNSKV